jgi:hypothetical protein
VGGDDGNFRRWMTDPHRHAGIKFLAQVNYFATHNLFPPFLNRFYQFNRYPVPVEKAGPPPPLDRPEGKWRKGFKAPKGV